MVGSGGSSSTRFLLSFLLGLLSLSSFVQRTLLSSTDLLCLVYYQSQTLNYYLNSLTLSLYPHLPDHLSLYSDLSVASLDSS